MGMMLGQFCLLLDQLFVFYCLCFGVPSYAHLVTLCVRMFRTLLLVWYNLSTNLSFGLPIGILWYLALILH